MFYKIKSKLVNWLGGYMPVPNIIIREKADIIPITCRILLSDEMERYAISEDYINNIILKEMLSELGKYVIYEEVEIDGLKYKIGRLKVANMKRS